MMYNIPKDKQTLLFTHIRLAHGFSNHKKRLQAVQARLHAISILGEQNPFFFFCKKGTWLGPSLKF